jgi:hypothetical protein
VARVLPNARLRPDILTGINAPEPRLPGQSKTGQRCLADNAFERRLGRLPIDEPTWYNDLHPIGRTLLKDNGDVLLLLSEYERQALTGPDPVPRTVVVWD